MKNKGKKKVKYEFQASGLANSMDGSTGLHDRTFKREKGVKEKMGC